MSHHDHHHDHQHDAPAGATDVAECPVMPGSTVSMADARAAGLVREHEGRTYYLCCATCATRWDADPGKYAA